jgi:hypothetical protein
MQTEFACFADKSSLADAKIVGEFLVESGREEAMYIGQHLWIPEDACRIAIMFHHSTFLAVVE